MVGTSVMRELILERYSSYLLEISKPFLHFKVCITISKQVIEIKNAMSSIRDSRTDEEFKN